MNQVKKRSGRLIAFEGIDGTGKSTQISMLADFLRHEGYDVVTTREPSKGKYGMKIRQLYISRDDITLEEELELFLADRKEHIKELILPALNAGKIVLTDRYYLSTAAYQGAAGMDPDMIMEKNEQFAPLPDLVIYLTLPVSVAIDRIQRYRQDTLNAFEQEDYLRKVAQIFEKLDRTFIKPVAAVNSVDVVHKSVIMHVSSMLAPEIPP